MGDVCINGECRGGEPRDCSAGQSENKCINYFCDETLGCQQSVVECADFGLCTHSFCDPQVGCVYEPIDCDDNDCCTLDSCVNGQCVHESKCEDHNPCTIDVCNSECNWGTCIYEFVDNCYMSLGQTLEENPDVEAPRPLGDRIPLNGTNMVPGQDHSNTAEAYFWLLADECKLVYDIQITNLEPDTLEEAAHFFGPAAVDSVGGVVHTLPLGSSKVGEWHYCPHVRTEDLYAGMYYLVIFTSTGDMRAQIEFNPII